MATPSGLFYKPNELLLPSFHSWSFKLAMSENHQNKAVHHLLLPPQNEIMTFLDEQARILVLLVWDLKYGAQKTDRWKKL